MTEVAACELLDPAMPEALPPDFQFMSQSITFQG